MKLLKICIKPQNKCNIIEYKQHILDETFAGHIYLNCIRMMFSSFDEESIALKKNTDKYFLEKHTLMFN